MRHHRLVLLAFAALLLGVAGCKKPAEANSTEIVIGEFASMSGDTAQFGQSSNNGLQLKLEEINKAGGILGKPVRVVVRDDGSKPDEARRCVTDLMGKDKVSAIIGEVASSRSLAGAPPCQSMGIPMLSPASTNPDVTKVGDYIFRICFLDDYQGKVAATFAKDQGWKKIAVFQNQSEDYSKGLRDAFVDSIGNSAELHPEGYHKGDTDFQPQLRNIKDFHPDAVYVPGYYGEMTLILQQARRMGLTVPFFGGDGWDAPITMANPDAEGCFFTNHYSASDPRPETKAFVTAYQAKYGVEPDAMAVLGYDAMGVMADAIKRAGSADSKAVRDALAATKDYEGASGKISIDANRNASKPIVVLKITGKKATFFKSYPAE